jgi:glycosyltransferase involved in cell wall biosynthesis
MTQPQRPARAHELVRAACGYRCSSREPDDNGRTAFYDVDAMGERVSVVTRSRPAGAPSPVLAGRRIAIAHDYLTQRGGAERVVLAMARSFPDASIVTSLYEPDATYPEFASHSVVTTPLQRSQFLRRNHRFGLPLYAPMFSATHVDADLVLCSSSGWAHGVATSGRRLVYVHNTARWLYQSDEYLRQHSARTRRAVEVLGEPLRRWDRAKGRSADLVLTNSKTVQDRVARHWGVESAVLHPPHAADPAAARHAVPGLEPGYLLVVSRLLAHKRVDVLVDAMVPMPDQRLVVVGCGPEASALRQLAPRNCVFLGDVPEAELRWLYANCRALLSAAHEDFGLVVLEAMAFGRPVIVLRAGGFRETVVEGETGLFFERPERRAVIAAVRDLGGQAFAPDRIAAHAATFDQATFSRRLRDYAAEVLA